MLSRVAENLYWFARYIRRAENTARLVGVASQLQLDLPRSMRLAWRPMVDTVGAEAAFRRVCPEGSEDPRDADVVRFLLLDPNNVSSLRVSILRSRAILRTIRESLPQQAWEAVNDLYIYVVDHSERGVDRRYRSDFLSRIVDGCLKIGGLLSANASRDIGYGFMGLGTALEQADMTTRIVDAGASGLIMARNEEDRDVFRNMQWMAVLKSLEAYQTYQRQVRRRVTPEHVLRFLLQNPDFPRSTLFCISKVQRVLTSMPSRPAVGRHANRLLGLVRNADPAWLASRNPSPFMDEIQVHLEQLHEALVQDYFRG